MELSEVISRCPRTVEFVAPGSTAQTLASRMRRVMPPASGSGRGRARYYSNADARYIAAYHVVVRGLMRLGLPSTIALTSSGEVGAQLRSQTGAYMPDHLTLHVAGVVLTVEVPIVIKSEMDSLVDEP